VNCSAWGDLLLREIENFPIKQAPKIWYLGGPSLAIKSFRALIYVDLFTGGVFDPEGTNWRRLVVNVINPEEINHVDAVLSTHKHYDHCEKETLIPIYKNTKAVFIGPRSSCQLMLGWGIDKERIRCVKPGEKFIVKDIQISILQGADPHEKYGVSYMITVGGINIFVSGDDLYSEEYLSDKTGYEVDVALINTAKNPPGESVYMQPKEVILLSKDLKSKVLIPRHWDLWKNVYLNPEELRKYIKEDSPKLMILLVGDSFDCEKI